MRNMFRPRRRRPDPNVKIKYKQTCVTCGSPQPLMPVRDVRVTINHSEYAVTWRCPLCREETGVTFYAMNDKVAALLRDCADVYAPTTIVDQELGDAARRFDAWGLKRAVRDDLAMLPVGEGAVSGEWARVVADNM